MLIVLSPSLERLLIEMAVGDDAYPVLRNLSQNASSAGFAIRPLQPRPIAPPSFWRRLRHFSTCALPARLPQRPRQSASRIASRAWSRRSSPPRTRMAAGPGSAANPHRASARTHRSFQRATASPRRRSSGRSLRPSRLGLLTDVKVLDQAVAFLTGEFAKLSGNDHETRAALLHALSTRRAASFEAANSLNRVRNQLSDPALAYLALTFANLDRASLAGELIGNPRAASQDRGDGTGAAVAHLLGFGPDLAVGPRRRRDDGTRQPRLRPRSAAGTRARGRRRLAVWPTASAPAGGRIKPRGRLWRPWLRTTGTPSSPKTATG